MTIVMNNIPIDMLIYPCLVMFLFTIGLQVWLARKRMAAVKDRSAHYKYYETYSEEYKEPDDLHILSRNIRNQHEFPMYLYIGVALLIITGTASWFSVVLAWAFVLSRFLHSYIHLTSNHVMNRMKSFGLGMLLLVGLWLGLLF